MGGRGASSQSSRSGNTYGIHVRRNQSLKEITEGAHKAYSGKSRDNLRANLNANIYPSLAKAGRRLARAQKSKWLLERDLAEAKKSGNSSVVKTLTKTLKDVEFERQTQMINVKNRLITSQNATAPKRMQAGMAALVV